MTAAIATPGEGEQIDEHPSRPEEVAGDPPSEVIESS